MAQMRKNFLCLETVEKTGGQGAPFEGEEHSHRGSLGHLLGALEEIPSVLGGRRTGLPSNYVGQ